MNEIKTPIGLSIIVPVYNRPEEVFELLESLKRQTDSEFEIIIVEDGSIKTCIKEIEAFADSLTIKYVYKNNTGPGLSRNRGAENASGNYFIFLDSDCIVPEKYISTVKNNLNESYIDAYGGPDRAHEKFTIFQKAVNYVMTSFLTTGGIRGGGEKMDKFYPRSFNMGYSKDVFMKTGGFSSMRFGEDIDMSIRIMNNGFATKLLKEAFVFHKRRSNYRQFFKQVYNSGIARINLFKKYPESLKPVHFLPAVFIIGCVALIILSVLFSYYFILPVILYVLSIFFDSMIKNKSLTISILSVVVCFIQQTGYGSGFLYAFWRRIILKKVEFSAYNKSFYK